MSTSKKSNFTQVNHNLLASTELSGSQKLFISYIIGWQENGKTCFQSNQSLADTFGLSKSGIRKIIASLNKYIFFSSTQYGERANVNNWTSTHEIKVDVAELNKFLSGKEILHQTDVSITTQSTSISSIVESIEENESDEIPSVVDEETEEETEKDYKKVLDSNGLYSMLTQVRKNQLTYIIKKATDLDEYLELTSYGYPYLLFSMIEDKVTFPKNLGDVELNKAVDDVINEFNIARKTSMYFN